MEHTRGPWERVDVSTGSATKKEQLCHNGYAAIQIQHDGSDEGEANARLIAAAPRMKDALWAIANMQVKPETDHAQLSALCISIAQIALAELEGRES